MRFDKTVPAIDVYFAGLVTGTILWGTFTPPAEIQSLILSYCRILLVSLHRDPVDVESPAFQMQGCTCRHCAHIRAQRHYYR